MKVFLMVRQFTFQDGAVMTIPVGIAQTESEAATTCQKLDEELQMLLSASLIKKTPTGPIDLGLKVNDMMGQRLGITGLGHGFAPFTAVSPILKAPGPKIVLSS
jgi:hypothetical protein